MTQNSQDQGTKHDDNKPMMQLISPWATEELARVLTFGAKTKYGARNWEKGIEFGRVLGSVKRHITAIEKREDRDPESGLLHAAHAMCNCMFLCHYMLLPHLYAKFDDRPQTTREKIEKKLDELNRKFINAKGNNALIEE